MNIPEALSDAEECVIHGKHIEALNLVRSFLTENATELTTPGYIFSYYKAGCLLIDIGTDLGNLDHVTEGLNIIESNIFTSSITAHSREYNTGNAKKAIFDIRTRQPKPYSEEHLSIIIQAKNHYWRALKDLPEEDLEFKYQIIVNIANTLDNCGRVTEALHLYAQALHLNEVRFEAHAAKASALRWLNNLSEGYTAQLVFIIAHHLRKALKSVVQPAQKASLQYQLMTTREALKRHGFTAKQFDRKHRLSYRPELYKHLDFPSFCLNYGLYLSTHSTYCTCNAGTNDGLASRGDMMRMIAKRGLRDAINIFHMFNRIVTEYVIGRAYLYQSQVPDVNFSPKMTPDACIISSFRHTYGVFDKIAITLLIAHQISFKPNEQILFESFWRSKTKLRDLVFSERDFNLISLYTIATDLEIKEGELRFFKEYRNVLEHSTLIFTKKPIFEFKPGPLLRVSREQAGKDLISMTRVARSAIHSLYLHLKSQSPKLAE